MRPDAWIPLAECVAGRVYRIRSRNLVVGVFDGKTDADVCELLNVGRTTLHALRSDGVSPATLQSVKLASWIRSPISFKTATESGSRATFRCRGYLICLARSGVAMNGAISAIETLYRQVKAR